MALFLCDNLVPLTSSYYHAHIWGEYLCLQSLSGWSEAAKEKLPTPRGELGKPESLVLGMPPSLQGGAFWDHISLCHSIVPPHLGTQGPAAHQRLLDLAGILTEYSVNRLNYDLVSPGASSDELGLSCEHPDHFQLWKSPPEGNILSGFPKTWKSKGGGGQAAPCLGTLAAAVHPEKSNSEDLQGLLLPHSHRTCLMMATGMNLIWRRAVVTVKISFNFRVFYVFSKN